MKSLRSALRLGACSVLASSVLLSSLALAAAKQEQKAATRPDLPPLPIEETGAIRSLPKNMPESWMYVDEAAFFSMFGGKVIVLDVMEERPAKRIKAIADKNLLGNFKAAQKRDEFYIMESFHARGSRGPREDVLAIYDKTTFKILKEIVWKDATRLTALPERYSMGLSKDERFLYVANFSPAASFSVVDLDKREVVDVIGTPGCVLTYPTGERSVTSLCSNGGLLTTVLDKNGKKSAQHRIKPFFDTDKTPIFERPAIIDGMAYFPGFAGKMHTIDLRGDVAKFVETWDLITPEERKTNWRPGGLGLNDKDEQGLMYMIAHENGADGTQTHGGSHVWVIDVKNKKRLRKLALPGWGISIAVTRGKEPKLVVTNGDLNLDIIDPKDGKLIQTISDFGNVTPLLVHKAY
ncbi:amine dehydrogenase large subunit [uncultured Pseudoteredinibacter sp.]|uniref:amine dehydrogenase large subunit n=1 Tax=uncultured Pseudoteredinibacter sp. TaxID=1641701 RepID=UPI0026316652|nr:amine dehydrogenase large subunit [uncultured Pseudoteredinibacter sp.]MCV6620664.1 methylamine dehydrogenase [Cellvibrionaceae bacterium]